MLSRGTKWELVKDAVGYGDHARYLERTFERDVFRTEDLKAVVVAAVTAYMSDLDSRENELLVQLRADLADSDLGRGRLRTHLASDNAFRREYWRLSATLLPLLVKNLHFTTSREVLAFIAMDIGTQLTMEFGVGVAAELGLDATILTTGFVGGAATLGGGLVVSLVVDAVIDWILKQMGHDPEAEISEYVLVSVKQLSKRLIDGEAPVHQVYGKLQKLALDDWDSSVCDASRRAAERIERRGRLGLRWQLQRIQEVRSRLRQESLRKLLQEGTAVKRLVGFGLSLFVIVLLLALLFAGLIRGFTTVKQYGNENKWWDAPPSLGSLDPKEREAAANEAARQYGAKP